MFYLKSIFIGLFSSLFIYLNYFQIEFKIIDTILALMFIYTILISSKKELFWGGLYSGILWFWWFGYSFAYYDLLYLAPFAVFAAGIIYGILFYLGALSQNLIYRVAYFFALSYIVPFGFNWYKNRTCFLLTVIWELQRWSICRYLFSLHCLSSYQRKSG